MKLGHVFNPRRNALNAWRLLLAAEVIVCHSWGMTGRVPSLRPFYQLLLNAGVDGFFAISGFLITASWLSNPRLREFLGARALRILPGFYVCLLVTAFVIAPIGVAMQGGSGTRLITSGASLEFVLKNSAVALVKFDIGGTPRGIPAAGAWNGSLWSLMWEVMCYLVVAAIGVVGLANRRWISPAIFVAALLGTISLPTIALPEGTGDHQQGGVAIALIYLAARAAIMFSAGAFLYQWRDVIPARWSLVVVSAVIVAASSVLPNYRMVAAIPLAYAVIVSGALIHSRRLRLRTDLSYGVYIYASPMQQVLAMNGLIWLTPLAFAALSAAVTLPLAALSWFLVEKPAQALKHRLKRKELASDVAEDRNGCAEPVVVTDRPIAQVPDASPPHAPAPEALSP
jgi:peptidoglycan/LPS O-acetylase OafA/YrhL